MGFISVALRAIVVIFYFGGSVAFSAPAADPCQFIRDQIAAGAVIQIPAGTFVCASPVILDRDGITLKGAGPTSTTLRLADGANSPLLVLGDARTPPAPVRNLTVGELSLDGNTDAQSGECWGGPCDTGGTTFVRNNGITVRGVLDSRIEHVRTFRARSGGVVTERNTRRLVVDGLESFENYFDGLAGCETEESVFRNLDLHHNRSAGISLDIRFSRNQFVRGRLHDNQDLGVFARWGEANEFRDLVIENNNHHGIFLAAYGLGQNCAQGFVFDHVEVRNNGGFGLSADDPLCRPPTVRNSHFRQNAAGCLRLPKGTGLEGAVCEDAAK